jgi:hypothetical protein
MKKLSGLFVAGAFATALAVPAFAGPAGVSRSTSSQVDPTTIAALQEAAQKAIQDGRNGNKNNPEYGRKAYQINQLIDRLKAGDAVDPSEIDQALEPVHVW